MEGVRGVPVEYWWISSITLVHIYTGRYRPFSSVPLSPHGTALHCSKLPSSNNQGE